MMKRSHWTMGLTLAATLMAGPAFIGSAAAQDDRPEARPSERRQERPRDAERPREQRREQAQERRPDGPPQGMPVRSLLRDIDLNDQQSRQVREIMQEHGPASPAAREHRQQLAEVHAQMREARQQNDREKFMQAAGRLFDVLGTAPDHTVLQGKIREVLTPEQREKFDANLAAMQERMQQREADRPTPRDDERPRAQQRDGEGDGPRARPAPAERRRGESRERGDRPAERRRGNTDDAQE